MKYLFCLLIVISMSGCLKQKESPCLDYVNDISAYSPLVFSFIDADSTNLLENKTIDTAKISIKDEQGKVLDFNVFLDSTKTKARYISIPIGQKQGTNEFKISHNNMETSFKYDFAIVNSECGSYHTYDNYVLNANPYQLKNVFSYTMVGNQKIPTLFQVVYIKE